MSFLMKNFSLRKMIVGHSTSMVLQTKRDVATLEGEGTSLSNKLDFDVTNNVVEYEACIIRLQDAISLNIQNLKSIWGFILDYQPNF